MHNIIYPSKDTTIYTKYPELNTGLDEILEITKEISSSVYFYRGTWNSSSYYKRYDYIISASESTESYYAVAENINETPVSSPYWVSFNPLSSNEYSRALIKFDLSTLQGAATASVAVAYLNLYTSIAREIPIEYTLEIHPMTGSWEMGVGNFTDKKTTGGATWTRRTSEAIWNVVEGGGDWVGGYAASQSFNFAPTDIRVDVTNIFTSWINGTNVNDGFIIKRPTTNETGITKYGSLSFYSMDTHTVYVPTLEIAYDDHVYDTSSFLIYNANRYETSTTASLNIESASLKYATTSTTSINVQTASAESESTFSVAIGLDYIGGQNIIITASLSQSAILTGTVYSYDNTTGAMTASWVTTAGGSGSYSLWSVNLVGGEVGYRDQKFLVDAGLAYTNGQRFIMTGSATQSMEGTVASYSVDTGAMTGSITNTTGEGTRTGWNVSLVSGEEIGYSVTGSVSGSLTSGSVDISMKNFMPEYKYNTSVRFRINVQQSYETKTFYEELRPSVVRYLPDTVYYQIIDAYSDRIMIPFSDYTRLSLDKEGHYFDMFLSGFMPERFYKIIFKATIDGAIQYFDSDNQFKVVK